MSDNRNNRLPLTIALNDYDHVRDLVDGIVEPEGLDLNPLILPVEEIFFRFSNFREWHVSELSLAKYSSLRARGDDGIVAIPVFPSRLFRHSAIFIRTGGPIHSPNQLIGARIGIPEWTQTATVYTRGLLEHEYGVPVNSVQWFQAGVNEPGRVEGISLDLPSDITITAVPDKTLSEMLLADELDAVISAHPPEEMEKRTGRMSRLFSNYREVEAEYFRTTGIFPIMHLISVRADVYHEHPWVLASLFKAFEVAKQRSLTRIFDANTSRIPIPWGFSFALEASDLMGADPWPYGIEPNRVTLDAFLQMAFEQHVCERRLSVDELFPPEIQRTFRI